MIKRPTPPGTPANDVALRPASKFTMPLLLMLVCTFVSGAAMFTGFLALGEVSPSKVVLSLFFTIIVTMALAYCAVNMFDAPTRSLRRIFAGGYLITASISVLMGFGMYFDMISAATLAKTQVGNALTAMTRPLLTAAAIANENGAKARDIARWSATTANRELTTGGTCGDSAQAAPGPRQVLRNTDRDLFEQEATALEAQATALSTKVKKANAIKSNYTVAGHDSAVSQINDVYAEAGALLGSGTSQHWHELLARRIKDAGKPMINPATGHSFVCNDPVLLAKLEAASKVAAPTLPDKAPEISEPTHAASVRRGLSLATFQTPFEAKLDLLPLLLGMTVDALLLIFTRAHSLTRPDRPKPPAEPAPTILDRILGRSRPDVRKKRDMEDFDAALGAEAPELLEALVEHSCRRKEKMIILIPKRAKITSKLRNFILVYGDQHGFGEPVLTAFGQLAEITQREFEHLKVGQNALVRVWEARSADVIQLLRDHFDGEIAHQAELRLKPKDAGTEQDRSEHPGQGDQANRRSAI